MFDLILGMCCILLVFIAMCAVEKIPGVDRILEKSVEVMTTASDGQVRENSQQKKEPARENNQTPIFTQGIEYHRTSIACKYSNTRSGNLQHFCANRKEF